MNNAHDFYGKADYKSAAKLYREQIKINPTDGLAHQGLARCMFQLRDFSTAWVEASRALELDPNLAISHLVLANILTSRKDYEQAEVEARKAIELDPNMWEAHNGLGTTLSLQSKFEECLSVFRKAVDLAPNAWRLRYNFSLALSRQKLYSDSLKEAKKSFWLHPSFQTAYLIYRVILYSNRILTTIMLVALFLLAFLMPNAISLWIKLFLVVCLVLFDIGEIKYGKNKRGVVGLLALTLISILGLLFVRLH